MPAKHNTRDTDLTSALSLPDLEYHAMGWALDGDVRNLAREYVQRRKDVSARLLWFLRRRKSETCGTLELRAFFAYLRTGHEEPEGRWGNARETEPLAPSTIKQYHTMLRAFWNFVVAEKGLDVSPMSALKAPIARPDQIQPFTADQQRALLTAAKKSRYSARNVALVLFLLDTGARASELCALRYRDLALSERSCRVLGKGGKERTVCFGAETTGALWSMLRTHTREEEEPLFLAEGGRDPGKPLTRMGLRIIVMELGKQAGIRGVRCSPHTLRHTFAWNWCRAGGDPFTLQVMMGHSSPAVTARYVALAKADVQAAHRKTSALDQLLRDRRR